MKKKLILSFFIVFLLLSCLKIDGLCATETGYYNAIELIINQFIDPEVRAGETRWYYFDAPPLTTTNDQWVILRLIGHSENGNLYIELMDEHLNVVKGGYALNGDHMEEIVCRLDNTIEGTTGTYMPRLVRGQRYFVKVSGVGEFTIGLNTYNDDHSGEFDNAEKLVVGNEISGVLERDDDIDSFCFQVPDTYSYKITVFATKKMNARITDESNYSVNTNNLRVLRDRGTAEYTVSGYGTIRYIFLYGNGGTHYKISVAIDKDPSKLGLWTTVNANYGNNYIRINTLKGAKISIIVKAGKNNKKLYFRGTKKKKKSTTQKVLGKDYYLNRRLRSGDVVIVTATKKRYKEFNFKKKIKKCNICG
ncbi:hypothetical protein [Butyrivibrio sp. LC3010]|uniref:hypothetical protein n=1 Tax=Butyrivibrio sp. LC3010 TaxID=1280680 RepID=UPI000414EC94|nr:hypothetical protein [Butyrivibrio sp. LC3010]